MRVRQRDEDKKAVCPSSLSVCVCVCKSKRGKKTFQNNYKGAFVLLLLLLLGEVLNKAANGLVVELSIYGECCSLLASQSIHGRVGTILVVCGLDLDL